jgi:NifU-like protein involved in Fe-S cluster formation
MKCNECKWFVGTVNNTYGLCKRYPTAQNKTQHDWCGDFTKLELKIKQLEQQLKTYNNEPKPTNRKLPK